MITWSICIHIQWSWMWAFPLLIHSCVSAHSKFLLLRQIFAGLWSPLGLSNRSYYSFEQQKCFYCLCDYLLLESIIVHFSYLLHKREEKTSKRCSPHPPISQDFSSIHFNINSYLVWYYFPFLFIHKSI